MMEDEIDGSAVLSASPAARRRPGGVGAGAAARLRGLDREGRDGAVRAGHAPVEGQGAARGALPDRRHRGDPKRLSRGSWSAPAWVVSYGISGSWSGAWDGRRADAARHAARRFAVSLIFGAGTAYCGSILALRLRSRSRRSSGTACGLPYFGQFTYATRPAPQRPPTSPPRSAVSEDAERRCADRGRSLHKAQPRPCLAVEQSLRERGARFPPRRRSSPVEPRSRGRRTPEQPRAARPILPRSRRTGVPVRSGHASSC